MKKFLSLAALAVTSFCAAQTEKGNFLVSGASGINFSSNNISVEVDGTEVSDDDKTSTFTFNTAGGYFVADDLAVGLELSYVSDKREDALSETISRDLGATVFGQYYFDLEGSLKPYVRARLGLLSTNVEFDGREVLDGSGFAYGGRAGVAYFLNDTVSFDFLLDYTRATIGNDNVDTINSIFSVGAGITLFL